MLTSLLVATLVSASPVQVTVEAVEYITQKPLVGAKVKLLEESAAFGARPIEVTSTTAAKGKARFEVPHLQFKFAEATKAGYLTREELEPFRAFVEQKYLDKRTQQAEDELHFKVWLLPSNWIQENVKVRTREQALAITNDWARACSGNGPTSLERSGERWIAVYPCMEVRVLMRNGEVFVHTPDVASGTPLYPLEEALADALSSPLEYVGTGIWPGQFRVPSCVYRNKQVIVVNSYCTIKELSATGIKVFHPEKGLVGFYAEAQDPISTIGREDYENWSFSSSEPVPGLHLNMKFDEVVKYEERRVKFAKSLCSAGIGVSVGKKNGSCYLKTQAIEQWWEGQYKPLLKQPPAGWHEIIKVLRKRAPKEGQPDPR
ncbi:MAG TPA: hypothetical protein VF815_16810 [Myxococcaceae bacterium]|jgi:hypothetical protein